MECELEIEDTNCPMPIFDNIDQIEAWFDKYVKDILEERNIDNVRVARVNNPDEIKEYMRILNEGCCGVLDINCVYKNEAAICGCNYGH